MNASAKKARSMTELGSIFLNDESFHDVTLRGSDGKEVTANKAFLAGRCQFFYCLFFKKFAEATKCDEPGKRPYQPLDDVHVLDFPGGAIKAVMEFLHTGMADVLIAGKPCEPTESNDAELAAEKEQVAALTALAVAANFLGLPELIEMVDVTLAVMLDEMPPLSLHLLECCVASVELASIPQLKALALLQIRQNPKGILMPKVVNGLPPQAIEEILQDDKMTMKELDLFLILLDWMKANPVLRKPFAVELMAKGCICLEKVDPMKLKDTVKPSGIVSADLLLHAFEKQSIALYGNKTIGIEELRCSGDIVWKESGSKFSSFRSNGNNLTNSLECPPMTSGLYEWTLEVVGDSSCDLIVQAGLSSAPIDSSEFIHKQKWSVFSLVDGQVWQNVPDEFDGGSLPSPLSVRLKPFHVGEKMTFELNLLPGQKGNGTLSISKEDMKGSTQLISNLLDIFSDDITGFVPVVSTGQPTRVRLLEFKKLQD